MPSSDHVFRLFTNCSARLDQRHGAQDQAVCDANGCDYDVLNDEEEMLRRLLALNLERAPS